MAKYKMPIAETLPPKLEDLFHIQRWMCGRCGLIFDFQFRLGPGEPGWMDIDPPLEFSIWVDEDGNMHEDETERKELCPRCGALFNELPLITVLVREPTKKLSDFFTEGDGEGETIEFKEQISPDNIRKTVAAFATCKGGRIILGITNEGKPVGYKEEYLRTTEGKDKLQQRIRGIIESIKPQVYYRILFVEDELGQHYVVIEVPKGILPIYSVEGRVYIRIAGS
jgi:ribosomal protein S27AE